MQAIEFADEASKEGHRTLFFAKRSLSDQELEELTDQLGKAERDLQNKEKRVEEIQSAWETDLELLGVSSVEDKL